MWYSDHCSYMGETAQALHQSANVWQVIPRNQLGRLAKKLKNSQVMVGKRMTLQNGSRVLITYKGRELEGRVLLASKNQQSLMLEFDGMLGGYVGTMPVLLEIGGFSYRDLIEQEPVEIREL